MRRHTSTARFNDVLTHWTPPLPIVGHNPLRHCTIQIQYRCAGGRCYNATYVKQWALHYPRLDTARWTALHRATESARPDALFSDPLAERLAGEQGRAIVANVPWTNRSGWWLVARTKSIDDAIAGALAGGCDRVLNLAAGLDTRPYRLNLPAELTWIEADLPKLLAEKTQLLADQTPRCRLTRTAVDLAIPHARDAFFNDALDGATKAFVLTEGLSMYLETADIAALSAAIKRPEVTWWMLDFAFPGLRKQINKNIAGIAAKRTVQVRTRERADLLRRPRLADRRSGIGARGRLSATPLTDMDAPTCLAAQSDLRHPGNKPTSAVALFTH